MNLLTILARSLAIALVFLIFGVAGLVAYPVCAVSLWAGRSRIKQNEKGVL